MAKIVKEASGVLPANYALVEDDRPTVSVHVNASYRQSDQHDCKFDWCCRPDTETVYEGVTVTPNGRTPVRQKFSKGDRVHVVIAEYSTGDTFGSDTGVIDVIGVEADSDAAELLAIAAREATGFSFDWEGWNYHVSWTGYFESLSRIFVEQTFVQKGKK